MRKFLFLTFFCLSSPILAATLPQASLMVSPSVGAVDAPFVFNASDSRSSAGTSVGLKYRFKFSQDSAWTDFTTKSRLTFRPPGTGNFRAWVQIKDASGKLKSTTRTYRVRISDGRSARIKISKKNITDGEEIFYELVTQKPLGTISDKILSRWDFDSDGRFDTKYSRQKIVSHVFSLPGQYVPTVQVKWPDGEVQTIKGIQPVFSDLSRSQLNIPGKDWEKVNVRLSGLVAPVVQTIPTGKEFQEGQIVQFDARGSKVPRAGWIEWHFDGAKVVKKEKVSYRFNTPGKHVTRVKTCYRRSNPICEETLLNFQIKPDPLAFRVRINLQNLTHSEVSRYGVDPFFASVGDKISFRAELKRPAYQNAKFQYRWDFEGDGKFDTDFSRLSSAVHIFDWTGNFLPQVEVWSDGFTVRSQVVTGTRNVFIVKNTAPDGDFYAKIDPIFVGDRVQFYSESWDRETPANQLKHRWDIDGDGSWETEFQASRWHTWRFESPGTVQAKMQIQDRSKKIKTITRTFEIFDLPPPKARVQVSGKYGQRGENFYFDGARSQGRNLKYIWHFSDEDKKGLQKYVSYSSRVAKNFSRPGKKKVALQVMDREGRDDWVDFVVYVLE